jgi:hypothetical protein
VRNGDESFLKNVSDRSDEVNRRGPDSRTQLTPDKQFQLAFSATRTGHVGSDTHCFHIQLARFEVYPYQHA